MNKTIDSAKSENWRHARTSTSVEIAWTNEQKADLWLWHHIVVTKIFTAKWKKKQDKANNSPRYGCAAIKHSLRPKLDVCILKSH